MRNTSDKQYPRRYGQYSRNYDSKHHRNQNEMGQWHRNRDELIRGDAEGYVEPHYRSEEYDRKPTGNYSREDYYQAMYDISNYDAIPRKENYGVVAGGREGYGDKIRHYPLEGDPYREERTHMRYSMGYNPNYDNPEEGDAYRSFDSRGNHGFRHDASYGNSNEFRDFGNDRYGETYDRSARDYDDRDNFR